MKFHSVHGCNIIIDEGGSRASRINSFCDGISFSHKPLAINSRISLLVGANEEWTGALRLGVTSQDPIAIASEGLPRYACPDLTSKQGYWARPLPEKWATNGTRLTFYVNSVGHFHLFVNNEHKGAVLIGLPVKEQLWVLLDLYGITVSVKFTSATGNAPTEVVARGPEAVRAYQKALTEGSVSYYRTRLALIGPPASGKTFLKKLLIKQNYSETTEQYGIDAGCICQTSPDAEGSPWHLVPTKCSCSNDNKVNNDEVDAAEDTNNDEDECPKNKINSQDEEYFQAIAVNIVRELLLQKKKKQEERRKTPLVRSAFRLQSSLSKIAPATKGSVKQDDNISNKDGLDTITINEDIPEDLPDRVVQLVDSMLREAENKQDWDKKETEKQSCSSSAITFNIWDYNGHSKYFILHQLFLSPQTIYLLAFDLTKELDREIQIQEDCTGLELSDVCELSTLGFIHLWLEVIYAVVSHSTSSEDQDRSGEKCMSDFSPLYPPVIIVGTHKDSLCVDAEIEHRFNRIKESLQDKAYYRHVLPTFYAVGAENLDDEDSTMHDLRKRIEELAIQLPHVGMEIPLKWMLFEQAIDRLLEREVFLADINKLSEVARLEDIDSDEEFHSMVHFYHHQGKIWHLGSDFLEDNDDEYNGIVILQPQWFINHIYQLLNPSTGKCLEENEDTDDKEIQTENDVPSLSNAVTSTEYFDKLWPNAFHHTSIFLGILDVADILCELTVPKEPVNSYDNTKPYLIPWLSERKSDAGKSAFNGLTLVLDFSGLLPAGFFTRFLTRLCRWSEQHNWNRRPITNSSECRIAVDYSHDLLVTKMPSVYSRIKLSLVQRKNNDYDNSNAFMLPSPHVCAKVRHLLETEAEILRDNWYKRISFSLCTPCPCERQCKTHNLVSCFEDECLHLLSLNDCLSKKIVECDYRHVKTDFIQKYFCNGTVEESTAHSANVRWNEEYPLIIPAVGKSFWGDDDVSRDDPQWLRGAAKMLNSANTGRDWIALAKRLGYSEREISRFEDDLHPGMTLLNSWLESNGRTRYCIDLLVSCLEQMGRQDVAERIQTEIGPELPAPPVFISYQWDAQDSVLHLRKRLELVGFPCWMDVGQLGGGDTLYGRIYEGISKAKVVLCCLTPRYALSPTCSREASLADVLRKPIVPVMLEPTTWPPPGALAIILSSLVYVDLCGIGGHGGCGRQADWESRFHEIVERLSHFIAPAFSGHHITPSSAGRLILPPTNVCKRHDDYGNAPVQADDRESRDDTAIPDEEDGSSVSSSLRDHRSNTPMAWDQPRITNRVVRCSICVLL